MNELEQCGIAAAKGYTILRLIWRNIVYKEKAQLIPLYKTIVTPHNFFYISMEAISQEGYRYARKGTTESN